MKTSINIEFTPEELNALYPKIQDIGIFDFDNEDLHNGIKKLILAYRDNVVPYILTVDKLTFGTTETDTKFVWVVLCYGDASLAIRYDKPLFQPWIWGEGANELLPEHVLAYWHTHADSILDKLHAGEKQSLLFIPN
jgi:hypothetical protein